MTWRYQGPRHYFCLELNLHTPVDSIGSGKWPCMAICDAIFDKNMMWNKTKKINDIYSLCIACHFLICKLQMLATRVLCCVVKSRHIASSLHSMRLNPVSLIYEDIHVRSRYTDNSYPVVNIVVLGLVHDGDNLLLATTSTYHQWVPLAFTWWDGDKIVGDISQ